MFDRNLVVSRKGRVWVLRGDDAQVVISTHKTQAEATFAGVSILNAGRGELIIERSDGTIRDRHMIGCQVL